MVRDNGMLIRDVRATIIDSPFKWVIVQVKTENGIVGTGEAWYAPGVVEAVLALRGLVLGRDARDIEPLNTILRFGAQEVDDDAMDWEGCVTRYGHAGGAVLEGPPMMAAAGFETALWDLVARSMDAPVFALLGGRYRSTVRMYADLHMPEDAGDPIEATLEAAADAVSHGFDAVKIDADLTFPTLHRDPYNRRIEGIEVKETARLIRKLRAVVGPDIDIAVDCHFQFSLESATRLMHALSTLDLLWVEDPLPYGNPSALRELSNQSSTPICFGEYIASADYMSSYLAQRSCQIIHPDVGYAGISEMRRMSVLADVQLVSTAMHNSGGPIATVASAHLAASLRNFLILENHNQHVPWWRDIVSWDGVAVEAGAVVLRDDAVGLGVRLDRSAVRHHTTDPDLVIW